MVLARCFLFAKRTKNYFDVFVGKFDIHSYPHRSQKSSDAGGSWANVSALCCAWVKGVV